MNWFFFLFFSLSRLITKDCDYQLNQFRLRNHSRHSFLPASLFLKLAVICYFISFIFYSIYRPKKPLQLIYLQQKASSLMQVAAANLLKRIRKWGRLPFCLSAQWHGRCPLCWIFVLSSFFFCLLCFKFIFGNEVWATCPENILLLFFFL